MCGTILFPYKKPPETPPSVYIHAYVHVYQQGERGVDNNLLLLFYHDLRGRGHELENLSCKVSCIDVSV